MPDVVLCQALPSRYFVSESTTKSRKKQFYRNNIIISQPRLKIPFQSTILHVKFTDNKWVSNSIQIENRRNKMLQTEKINKKNVLIICTGVFICRIFTSNFPSQFIKS